MSARTPSDYNQYNDESPISAGGKIIAGFASDVVDDQVFVLDQPELIISDNFSPVEFSGTSATELRRYLLEGKDACDDAATVTAKIYFYAYGTASPTYGLYCGTSAGSYGAAFVVGALGWYGPLDIVMATNGNLETLIISAQKTSGTNQLVLMGIAVVSD